MTIDNYKKSVLLVVIRSFIIGMKNLTFYLRWSV